MQAAGTSVFVNSYAEEWQCVPYFTAFALPSFRFCSMIA